MRMKLYFFRWAIVVMFGVIVFGFLTACNAGTKSANPSFPYQKAKVLIVKKQWDGKAMFAGYRFVDENRVDVYYVDSNKYTKIATFLLLTIDNGQRWFRIGNDSTDYPQPLE